MNIGLDKDDPITTFCCEQDRTKYWKLRCLKSEMEAKEKIDKLITRIKELEEDNSEFRRENGALKKVYEVSKLFLKDYDTLNMFNMANSAFKLRTVIDGFENEFGEIK